MVRNITFLSFLPQYTAKKLEQQVAGWRLSINKKNKKIEILHLSRFEKFNGMFLYYCHAKGVHLCLKLLKMTYLLPKLYRFEDIEFLSTKIVNIHSV